MRKYEWEDDQNTLKKKQTPFFDIMRDITDFQLYEQQFRIKPHLTCKEFNLIFN